MPGVLVRTLSSWALALMLAALVPSGLGAFLDPSVPAGHEAGATMPDRLENQAELLDTERRTDDAGPACETPTIAVLCNIWASRTPTGPANEVHIAVNPNDPNHVMVVAKDYSLGSNRDCANGGDYHVGSAYYVTFDGGATWNVGRIPAPYPNGGAQPSPLPNLCGSDPVAVIGEDGTAYYILLNFHYTGGRKAVIAVARSDDGGLTWDPDQIRVLHHSSGNDKEWGAVDKMGRVHVVWTDLATGRILYSRSAPDWTFETPRTLGFVAGGNPAVTVATGPGDEVYVVWRAASTIRIATSSDSGATFAPYRNAFTVSPYESSLQPRMPFMPQLAVDDDEGSPHAGRIYITWPDRREGGASAYLASSSDEGQSWTAPARIDDRPVTARRAIMPTVDVAPGGRVDVAWLDERFGGTGIAVGQTFHAFGATSSDGGASWSVNQQLSAVPLFADWSRHQNGGVFIGDYIGIASTPEFAWVTFPGNGPDRLAQGLPGTDFQRADAYVAPMYPGVVSSGAASHQVSKLSPAWETLFAGEVPVLD